MFRALASRIQPPMSAIDVNKGALLWSESSIAEPIFSISKVELAFDAFQLAAGQGHRGQKGYGGTIHLQHFMVVHLFVAYILQEPGTKRMKDVQAELVPKLKTAADKARARKGGNDELFDNVLSDWHQVREAIRCGDEKANNDASFEQLWPTLRAEVVASFLFRRRIQCHNALADLHQYDICVELDEVLTGAEKEFDEDDKEDSVVSDEDEEEGDEEGDEEDEEDAGKETKQQMSQRPKSSSSRKVQAEDEEDAGKETTQRLSQRPKASSSRKVDEEGEEDAGRKRPQTSSSARKSSQTLQDEKQSTAEADRVDRLRQQKAARRIAKGKEEQGWMAYGSGEPPEPGLQWCITQMLWHRPHHTNSNEVVTDAVRRQAGERDTWTCTNNGVPPLPGLVWARKAKAWCMPEVTKDQPKPGTSTPTSPAGERRSSRHANPPAFFDQRPKRDLAALLKETDEGSPSIPAQNMLKMDDDLDDYDNEGFDDDQNEVRSYEGDDNEDDATCKVKAKIQIRKRTNSPSRDTRSLASRGGKRETSSKVQLKYADADTAATSISKLTSEHTSDTEHHLHMKMFLDVLQLPLEDRPNVIVVFDTDEWPTSGGYPTIAKMIDLVWPVNEEDVNVSKYFYVCLLGASVVGKQTQAFLTADGWQCKGCLTFTFATSGTSQSVVVMRRSMGIALIGQEGDSKDNETDWVQNEKYYMDTKPSFCTETCAWESNPGRAIYLTKQGKDTFTLYDEESSGYYMLAEMQMQVVLQTLLKEHETKRTRNTMSVTYAVRHDSLAAKATAATMCALINVGANFHPVNPRHEHEEIKKCWEALTHSVTTFRVSLEDPFKAYLDDEPCSGQMLMSSILAKEPEAISFKQLLAKIISVHNLMHAIKKGTPPIASKNSNNPAIADFAVLQNPATNVISVRTTKNVLKGTQVGVCRGMMVGRQQVLTKCRLFPNNYRMVQPKKLVNIIPGAAYILTTKSELSYAIVPDWYEYPRCEDGLRTNAAFDADKMQFFTTRDILANTPIVASWSPCRPDVDYYNKQMLTIQIKVRNKNTHASYVLWLTIIFVYI